MPPAIVGLVLGAAVLHVAWNVLLKQAGDPLRTAAGAMIAAGVVSVPIGAAALLVGPATGAAPGAPMLAGPVPVPLGPVRLGPLEASLPIPVVVLGLAVVSGAVEALYLVLLSAAYRRGDLSIVYPTARGTAPVLAAVVGVVVLGERLALLGALGVLLLLGGLVGLVRPWQIVARRRAALAGDWRRDPAILAVATGVAIAGYTALDRVAVRLADPWAYGALVWPSMAVWTVLAERAVAGRRRRTAGFAAASALAGTSVVPPTRGTDSNGDPDPADVPDPADHTDPGRPDGPARAIAAGVLSYAAYGLVLLALSVAPLTAVAPLRESAIVVASGWGALRMREARSGREVVGRLGAALAVVGGAVLLAIE
jgi:drug/metabolite transporter (DMT)-like permease